MNDISKESLPSGKTQQFIATTIINLLSLSGGISCGWPSPIIPQLRSSNPPVGDTPMTEEQISWLSSLLPIGSLLIIPFCGILSEHLGRKKFAQLTALPQIISWSLIIIGRNHVCLYAARLLTGIATAMAIFISPMYISEIANNDIRGILGSLIAFSANSGILFAYVAGAFLSYRIFAGLAVVFPLIFFVSFTFVPESPIFLVRRDRRVEAHKSLMFFRGGNKALVEQELTRLIIQTQLTEKKQCKLFVLKEFIKDPATRMGLIICFILLGGQQLSGILAMLTYAETIFEGAGTSISSQTGAIIIGIIQIIGSYISTMLMDRAGRRILTLASCLGMAISHLLIGFFFNLLRYDYDLTSISWFPIVAFSSYIAFYCLGIGPVPFLYPSEIFRLDVSSSATTLCYVFYWTVSSVAVKTFGSAMNLFGFDVCFFVLASFCLVCFVMLYYAMPETKGRKIEDIVDKLARIPRIFSHDENVLLKTQV